MIDMIVRNNRLLLLIAIIAILLVSTSAGLTQPTDTESYASGVHGLAASAHPLASQAAIEMMKMGGNAVDAAVAAAFAIGVVEPNGSGLGGGGGMVIYMNDLKESYYIDYYHQTSGNIMDINYNPDNDRHTARSILIPGNVAGLTKALELLGTLPLETVMEPAIRYAEDGFEIDETLAQLILDQNEMIMAQEATAGIFLDEGFPRMQGDILVQPDLAKTLKAVAERGRDGFYSGPVAETIIKDVQALGGVLSLGDFKNYEAKVTRPLIGSYRGYRIFSANAPQSGSSIIQALNMLEKVDLHSMGHYSESAATLHLMAETLRRTYADRWTYLGDPDFSDIPLGGLISKKYADVRFNEINRYRSEPREYRKTQSGFPAKYSQDSDEMSVPDGNSKSDKYNWTDEDDEGKSSYEDWGEDMFDSWGIKKKKTDHEKKTVKDKADSLFNSPGGKVINDEEFDGHTTHLSVIDGDGNMVALTQTLGTFFGSGVTSAGVLLNCGMANFSQTAAVNMVRANMRPRSSISPTVVLEGDKPFMVVGSPGAGRIICTMVEVMVNAIDFGMNAYDANYAPRFYCQKFEDYMYLEGGISDEVRDKLERMGHTIKAYSARDLFFGGVQMILVDQKTGIFYGSADARRGGAAIGY